MPGAHEIAIIGGGASGLCAALLCARAGLSTRVIEAGRRVGKPILASGNGRCNFTNEHLAAQVYSDPAFVSAVLGDRPLDTVLGLFEGLGLWHTADSEGRCYPRSRAASSVLDVLLSACDQAGVTYDLQERVTDVALRERDGARFWLVTSVSEDGRERTRPFAAVIWCAGGGTAAIPCRAAGVAPVREEPVLCPLATDRDRVAGLDGVRVFCQLSILRGEAGGQAGREKRGTAVAPDPAGAPEDRTPVFQAPGEVLFRPYGISGVVTFDASRHARPGDTARIDLVPELDEQALRGLLEQRLESLAWLAGTPGGRLRFLDGALQPAVALRLMRDHCGRDGGRPIDCAGLACLLKRYDLVVRGTADERHAQLTRGGVPTGAVDPATLELAGAPGLFVCGEALDVDGPCGGYNLSWAWLSGMAAARAVAGRFGRAPEADQAGRLRG